MHRPKYHDTFVLLIFPHFSKYVFIMKYYTLQILIFLEWCHKVMFLNTRVFGSKHAQIRSSGIHILLVS